MPLDSPTRHPPGSPRLEARLRRELQGEVLFDPFSRGRYSTDASIYQIEPLGVVVPKDRADVAAALTIAREEGVPVLPRGGGTSQCGQTVARALVLDCSKFMDRVVALDFGHTIAEGTPDAISLGECIQGRLSAIDGRRQHSPPRQLFLQHASVRCVVVSL